MPAVVAAFCRPSKRPGAAVAYTSARSACCAKSSTLSNNVLNSIATDVASITSDEVMRCGDGFFGEVKNRRGMMSNVGRPLGVPPTSTASTVPTRPIWMPL